MIDALAKNWPLKLLALLLAFAIWVAVTGEAPIVQDFRVPVDIAIPEELIPTGAPPTAVSVRLRGQEAIFRRLDRLRLELHVDLRDAATGPRNVQFSPADLDGVPQGIEVVLIDPDRFRLVLERRARKLVPVVATFVGQPPPGYAVYDVSLTPDALEVEGPASRVVELTRLRTDPIHLEDKVAPFSAKVSAVPVSPDVRVVDSRPLEALVTVDSAPSTRTFSGVPVVPEGSTHDAKADPSALTVSVSGPSAMLGALRPGQIRAIADAAGLSPRAEPYQVPVRLDLVGVPEEQRKRFQARAWSRSRVSVTVSRRGGAR